MAVIFKTTAWHYQMECPFSVVFGVVFILIVPSYLYVFMTPQSIQESI